MNWFLHIILENRYLFHRPIFESISNLVWRNLVLQFTHRAGHHLSALPRPTSRLLDSCSLSLLSESQRRPTSMNTQSRLVPQASTHYSPYFLCRPIGHHVRLSLLLRIEYYYRYSSEAMTLLSLYWKKTIITRNYLTKKTLSIKITLFIRKGSSINYWLFLDLRGSPKYKKTLDCHRIPVYSNIQSDVHKYRWIWRKQGRDLLNLWGSFVCWCYGQVGGQWEQVDGRWVGGTWGDDWVSWWVGG